MNIDKTQVIDTSEGLPSGVYSFRDLMELCNQEAKQPSLTKSDIKGNPKMYIELKRICIPKIQMAWNYIFSMMYLLCFIALIAMAITHNLNKIGVIILIAYSIYLVSSVLMFLTTTLNITWKVYFRLCRTKTLLRYLEEYGHG